jgi:aminopeptidase YwaD
MKIQIPEPFSVKLLKTFLGIIFLITITKGFTQPPPLVSDSLVRMLDAELSGESAKRNLEYITRLHRMRGSAEFKKAIDFIESKLKEYGLAEIEVFQLPADGKTMYGSQKSRPMWEGQFAELWELEKEGSGWKPKVKLADYESMPIVLAEDSESGEVQAELIDIGGGTSAKDYTSKNVKGKLVLTSSSPSSMVDLAIGKYGAAGIISYAQNQRTAWWKEDENLIRWGHFDSFSKTNAFAFMISLKQAREFQQRLSNGETILLHAKVEAGKHEGAYSFATAVIKGSSPELNQEEIAFTCHLDHQRPGANDNASGSMTILEIARTINKLIKEGKLSRPARTLRFIWSPEIEGTSALLSERPEYAKRVKAVVHMDMVGGGPITKSIFHVSRTPKSLPSFVSDVGELFGRYLNEQTDAYASGYPYSYAMVSKEGGKEPLQAVLGNFHLGSDHEVYSEGSFKIPAIYLHDWPDRYIHTNFDLPANIDPTKLKRAGFIGAASGYFLAQLNDKNALALWGTLKQQALRRSAEVEQRSASLSKEETENLKVNHFNYERNVFASLKNFISINPDLTKEAERFYSPLEASLMTSKAQSIKPAGIVYKRNPAIKGPMFVFSYSYLSDHFGEEKIQTLKLLNYQGMWGGGSEYAYEVLNFVDGKRTVSQIHGAVSAEFGPVPYESVDDYLKALEIIQVIVK